MRLPMLLLILLGMTLPNTAALATGGMSFHGTLIEPPPCTIQNSGGDNAIIVDFGERVGITRVNGVNYKQQVNYRIICDPGVNPWEMKLTVKGSATNYDTAALQTNLTDLGIKLLLNGTDFTINVPRAIDRNDTNSMILEAVPVKRAGSTLPESTFIVTATLLAEYQ